jgi:outer membrane usher protein FimD/PapC
MWRGQTASRAARSFKLPLLAIVLAAAAVSDARAVDGFPSLRIAGTPAAAAPTAHANEPRGPELEPALKAATQLRLAQVTPVAAAAYETLIARVSVNGVPRGDTPALRDPAGRILVPAAEFRNWGLAIPAEALRVVRGDEYVALYAVPELDYRFDLKAVALSVNVAAKKLPPSTIDLRWRFPGAQRPRETSAFLNYSLFVTGDDAFRSRATVFTTEAGVRAGDLLFYSSGVYRNQTDDRGYTRLETNVTWDRRDSLQRLILGDFFAPVAGYSTSLAFGGASFSKLYRMDPYFIQFPTLNLRAMAATPSEVEVRLDGNVMARRQVAPGPIDIANITGYAGQRNVEVVVRDAFGREQVIAQPYYFTDFALKEGLHEYSPGAFTGFHRYAFTDYLTLGLRGEARDGMVNAGPFATVLLPRAGILGVGVSASQGGENVGHSESFSYSYTGNRFQVGAIGRILSRDYVQLPDGQPSTLRNAGGVSVAYSPPGWGTVSTGYSIATPREGESTRAVNLGYNTSLPGGRGTLTLGYTHNFGAGPQNFWFATFRYFLDRDYSVVANANRLDSFNSQAVALEKTVPVGQGYGFSIGGGRVDVGGDSAFVGNAFGQYNGEYATVTGRYQPSSNAAVNPGLVQVSVAGGIGYVRDRVFVSRPITDSFAVVKVGDVPGIPVVANGQLAGTTDERGEVVVPSLLAFYDNFIAFDPRSMPLDYTYSGSQVVVSPAYRSGQYLVLDVKRSRAVFGRLERDIDGRRVAIEFRELRVVRDGKSVDVFTARRGEFYIENAEPGSYVLQVTQDPACTATIVVPKSDQAVTDLGAVLCTPAAR